MSALFTCGGTVRQLAYADVFVPAKVAVSRKTSPAAQPSKLLQLFFHTIQSYCNYLLFFIRTVIGSL